MSVCVCVHAVLHSPDHLLALFFTKIKQLKWKRISVNVGFSRNNLPPTQWAPSFWKSCEHVEIYSTITKPQLQLNPINNIANENIKILYWLCWQFVGNETSFFFGKLATLKYPWKIQNYRQFKKKVRLKNVWFGYIFIVVVAIEMITWCSRETQLFRFLHRARR